MPGTSSGQRKTVGRVMHEYAHGELRSGPGGKAGKVKNRKQAVDIALKEAGESKYERPKANAKNLARSKRKEAAGETGQQETEGKSHVGARRTTSGKRKATKKATPRKKRPVRR